MSTRFALLPWLLFLLSDRQAQRLAFVVFSHALLLFALGLSVPAPAWKYRRVPNSAGLLQFLWRPTYRARRSNLPVVRDSEPLRCWDPKVIVGPPPGRLPASNPRRAMPW